MDPIPTTPSYDALTKTEYTFREWLMYYKNLWRRNLVARTIDIKTDEALKKENPEMGVAGEQGQPMPVKERLEHRKILVHDALELLKAIDEILAIPDAELAEKLWSEKALAVAEDMIPKPEAPKVGDACTTSEGKPGSLKSDGQGGLVCEAAPEAVAPAADAATEPAAPVEPSSDAKVD